MATPTIVASLTTPVIGIRDSGVGGLTVARCIRQLLPYASLLYFADTAHVPYGDRTPQEVSHFALSITEFLIGQGAQIVVFACNTSSAYALDEACQKFDVPIVGMIEPGARAAMEASGTGAIGVLATQATVESRVYTRWLQELRPGTWCLEVACPEFVPLVENEQTHSEAAHRACRRYMQPLLEAGVDTVILGCTHYPLLLSALREAAPRVKFVDPAEAVAAQVASLVGPYTASPGITDENRTDVFFVSGPHDGVRHWIEKLLVAETAQRREPNLRCGPVFDLPST